MIVIFFLVLILIIIFVYLKTKHENFDSIPVDTIDSVSKHECYLIIDTILNNIYKTYKKYLIRGNIDRIEKTFDEVNNAINYKINVFIYNPNKDTNKKIEFDVTYDNKNIILNSIKSGISREVLSIERDAVDERGSIVFKPKVNMDKVKKNSNYITNKKIDYPENKNKEKYIHSNKIILPLEDEKYDNDECVINSENQKQYWDCFGISTNDKRIIRNTPKFIVSNFITKNDTYNWLFDPSQDSGSRPAGISGATGSS